MEKHYLPVHASISFICRSCKMVSNKSFILRRFQIQNKINNKTGIQKQFIRKRLKMFYALGKDMPCVYIDTYYNK